MAEAGKKISEYTALSSINGNTVFVVEHANTTYSLKASVLLGLLNIFLSNTVPSNTSASGVKGDLRISNTHLYVCIANSSWMSVELSSF